MTPKRPKSLKWTGDMLPDGRPAAFLDFVPPEDLDEEATDALSQEQLAVIRNSGLYREVHESAPKRAKATTRAPQPRSATEPEPAGDEPESAAEPATESEDS